MGTIKNNDKLLVGIKKTVDILLLLELCKLGASARDIRTVLGSLDNNIFSNLNMIIKRSK